MKKIAILTMSLMIFICNLSSQNAQGLSFQGYARGAAGLALSNKNLTFKFSIYSTQENSPEFVETQTGILTDEYGIFNVRIGTVNVEDYRKLNFSFTVFSLKVEVLDNNLYQTLSNEQLMAVPYSKSSETAVKALKSDTAVISLNGCPPGTIMAYLGTSAPAGWLLCDGASYQVTSYSNLFAVIGVSCGNGGGLGSFNVPDLRGRFLRGFSGETNNDTDKNSRTNISNGGNTGNRLATYQGDATRFPETAATTENGSHSHTYSDVIWVEHIGPENRWGNQGHDNDNDYIFRDPVPETDPNGNHTHSLTGGNNETRPKNFSVNYIIKY